MSVMGIGFIYMKGSEEIVDDGPIVRIFYILFALHKQNIYLFPSYSSLQLFGIR
jgi:hypothetical protein